MLDHVACCSIMYVRAVLFLNFFGEKKVLDIVACYSIMDVTAVRCVVETLSFAVNEASATKEVSFYVCACVRV